MKQVSETHSMYNVKLLPAGWSSRRMFTLGKLKKQVVGDHWAEFTLLSLTLQGVIPRDLENRMGKMPTSFDTYQVVERDDLIFCLFDVEETPRTVGLATQEGIVTGAYTVMTPSRNVSPRFLYYQYLAFDQKKSLRYLYAGLRNTIRIQDFKNLRMAIPPLPVQEDIADFLDRETAEIDAFISDQEQLIELLEERRVAMITHAITKGLDPTAPMNASGVEWLGRVPEHWEMCSLRHLLKSQLKYGANEPATEADPEQVRYLRITDFDQRGQLRDETFRSLPEEIARNYMVLPNDVLLARSGATVGKAFIVPEDSPPACFAGYLIRVDVSREKILPEYFFLYTQTASFEAWKNVVMIQATIQNISADKYASLKVPLPPLAEQRHIVQSLLKEIAKIDTTIADAREAIALSRERRAALISAAVTGQIDVSQTQSRSSADEMLEEEVRV